MKKITFFVLSLFLSLSSFAEIPLDSFFKKGASWCDYEYHGAGFHTYWTQNFLYTIGYDSLINGHSYHLLYDANITGMRTIGGIRTDSDKVYFLKLDTLIASPLSWNGMFVKSVPSMSEVLLYDYNIAVGDSLKWLTYPGKVLDIDSVQISNGSFVKRYKLQNSSSTVFWLKGLGSYDGLFGSLLCCGDNGTFYYSSSNFSLAYPFLYTDWAPVCFPTSINSPEVKVTTAVYPNPLSDDQLHIRTHETINSLIIYDLTGKIRYRHAQKLLAGEHILYPQLPAGLYFVHINYEDGKTEQIKLLQL